MKKLLFFILGFFLLLSPLALSYAQSTEEPEYILDIESSYSFGMFLARFMLEQFDMPYMLYNYQSFMQGFEDYNEGRETRISFERAMENIDAVVDLINERERILMEAEGELNRERGAVFLAQNGLRPNVVTTASGLQIEMIREGTGDYPNIDDVVTVHYHGTLIDGRVFDSSYQYGEPLTFPLDRVIAGWTEGMRMLREGSRAILYIPSELAYGEMSMGAISPHSVLVFEIDFLEIVR